jgi:hypothetical protein
MQEVIENAKAQFLMAKDRLSRALANTPDDRINWSPSPSARTPIHQVAHSARSIKHILEQMSGTPFAIPTTAEADHDFREWEQQFNTREQVLDLLERNSAEYLAYLDALTPDKLDTMAKMPFGLGEAPVRGWLEAPPAHTNYHTAQIEYMQTIYGDQDWHL